MKKKKTHIEKDPKNYDTIYLTFKYYDTKPK